MPQSKLKNYLSRSDIENTYRKAINSQSKAFEFKAKELAKISPSNLVLLHDYVLNKQKEQGEDSIAEWSQSEKKVVNWLLLCYLQTNSKTVSQLDDQDYLFLSEITTKKPVELIKYHVQSSLKQTKRPKWTEDEDHILYQILAIEKKYPPVGEWSYVSKELFLRGDQESYKSGKNCRERWFNHVDPAIEKTWTIQQDLILLNHIKTKGKKWSSIIPELNHTKSEHMIKNRFHSLLRRKGESSKRESSLVEILIEELTHQLAQEMEKRRKDVNIVVKIDESQEKRILRSNSIKKQKEEPNMELLNSNADMNMTNNTNISQLIEGDSKKIYEARILDFIREESGQEEVKHTKEFNPYESIKFSMSSPLPPTPGPTGFLSSTLLSTPFGHEHQYNFNSLCQKFKSTLNE